MSNPFKLFRLQQVDSRLDTARERLAEIDRILGEDEALRAAQAKQSDATDARDERQKDLRRAEEDVQAQQIKLEQNQSTLYSGKVTNPKELEDLQLEAGALKRHLSGLEDVQLEKMVALEEAAAALDDAQQGLDRLRAERAKEHGELGEEQEQLTQEVGRLQEERTAALTGISSEDMAAYDKVRVKKNGLAVAKVEDKRCSACGGALSDALAQAARSPDALSYCASCKRILYAG
jgi:hypothetical protein